MLSTMKNNQRIVLTHRPLHQPTFYGPIARCPRCGRSGARKAYSTYTDYIHSYERDWGAQAAALSYRVLQHCRIDRQVVTQEEQ